MIALAWVVTSSAVVIICIYIYNIYIYMYIVIALFMIANICSTLLAMAMLMTVAQVPQFAVVATLQKRTSRNPS